MAVKFLATLGPHVKLPTEMSNFPTLGGPPGANVKVSKGSVKVYAWLGPYYPPHTKPYFESRRSVLLPLARPSPRVSTKLNTTHKYKYTHPAPKANPPRRAPVRRTPVAKTPHSTLKPSLWVLG